MRCLVPIAALIAAVGTCLAAPPPNLTPNPMISAWFKGLRQPGTDQPCCTIADCRSVSYRATADDGYEVFIEGAWYAVPRGIIVRRDANPIGSAIACYQQVFGYTTMPGVSDAASRDSIELLCFVPAAPTS
jgi:hypothetical protein